MATLIFNQVKASANVFLISLLRKAVVALRSDFTVLNFLPLKASALLATKQSPLHPYSPLGCP